MFFNQVVQKFIENCSQLLFFGSDVKVLAEHSDATNIQIQKGKFSLSGTPNYMSPILKSRFLYAEENNIQEIKLIDVDLFKSDIYSLGLTFLQAATGLEIG